MKPRPTFGVLLMELAMQQRNCSLDTVLKDYIEKYRLAIRVSLDEPPQITDVRTRLAILEESGLLDPANCNDEGLRSYAETLRGSLRLYSNMSPEARLAWAKQSATQSRRSFAESFLHCFNSALNEWYDSTTSVILKSFARILQAAFFLATVFVALGILGAITFAFFDLIMWLMGKPTALLRL